MISISFGLSCIGFILLSLSLKRHYSQVWPSVRGITITTSLDYVDKFQCWKILNRSFGYVFVFLSVVPCILSRGLWIGLILWIAILALAGFLQAMMLTYFPQRNPIFAVVSFAIIALGLFV